LRAKTLEVLRFGSKPPQRQLGDPFIDFCVTPDGGVALLYKNGYLY